MQPIGPLMHEHRLIERMVALMDAQRRAIAGGAAPDSFFMHDAARFMREYADACHHGKEEDILFRELARKELPEDLARIMAELVQEHRQGRKLVAELDGAARGVVAGEQGAAQRAGRALEALVAFYPPHIVKEDKGFFHPCMKLFSREEQDAMLAEYQTFEQRLLHELNRRLIHEFESR